MEEVEERRPLSSSAPEVVQPSQDPEVVPEEDNPKYVVDDGGHGHYKDGQQLPYDQHAYDQHALHELNPESAAAPRRSRICGLSPKRFWILVIIAVIVIAAAVGGGVGGALAGNSKSNASTTDTPSPATNGSSTSASGTPTSTAATASSTTGPKFQSGCNTTNNAIYTPLDTSNSNKPFVVWNETLAYQILCYVNLASATSGLNPGITEVQRLANVSSLDECITQCALYNSQLPDPQRNPDGPVDFGILCSSAVYAIGANHSSSECFLQSGQMANATDVLSSQEVDTAVLQWPGE